LGAYGFLGLVKGQRQFLQYIPAAIRSLGSIVSELEGLEKLAETISQLTQERIR
jgi:hypothetical protein